ncbi:MAG TPA: DUF4020 domain-containing protein [Gemmatimonadales bacterium]|nr:DUF4020 domain-containing protein [Gemmatimonadales bacterium]
MFVTTEVDLPDDLLEALQEGRLVVFAGAGVSMGSPSNLPDFERLARQVAETAIGAPTAGEPLDQYLGRAEHRGVDVQGRTRQLLDVASSKPTPMHEAIVRLFGAPDRIRIVTTNFDRHFATVITDRHGAGAAPLYTAPALPLGRQARGLIHVHGALDIAHHPLVLTDADFGRAYLTEGWATRLLLELFLHNTVCFVGYSHGDPTMRYLARSLVPGTARFALTTPGSDARWAELGIRPVHYPLRAPRDHGALSDALEAWANLATMGALDHEHRIRTLVSVAPPIERRDVDYLRRALADPVQRPFFVRHASVPAWLTFAADAGVLEPLFGNAPTADPGAVAELAQWLAERFMLEHSGELLDLLRAHHLQLGHQCWRSLAWHLAAVDPLPEPELLMRWITVLVTTRNPQWDARPLSQLLGRCPPEALAGALLLLGHLIAPVSSLGPALPGLDGAGVTPRLRFSIGPTGDDHTLRKSWQRLFLPALPRCHRTVGMLLTESLTRAHVLLVAAGTADGVWDPLSFRRSAIEPHPQDPYPSGLDVVVDAARDLLEFLLAAEPKVADAWITLWREAASPLLKRLAIHGLAERAPNQPAEALADVLAAGWLHDSALKHETFRLLARAYAAADEATRQAFLDAALVQPVLEQPPTTPEETGIETYERYNLLVWLARAAPDSAITVDRLAAAKAATPDLEPREHPDLTHWSSGVQPVIPVSPRGVDELLALSPRAELGWLLAYQGDQRTGEGPDRHGLLEVVRDASRASFEWSWELAEALRDHGEAEDAGLWPAVLEAWRGAALDELQWRRVLQLLETHRHLEHAFPYEVSSLLDHAAKGDGGAPPALLHTVRDMAERLALRDDLGDTVSTSDGPDWLFLAINHPAGRAAMAWLQTLETLRNTAGDEWTGLPPAERDRLDHVLEVPTVGADRARIIFASQAHFLYALDPEWSGRQLLPLFDWTVDEDRAAHAWDGYLQWGRWNDALFERLQPYLEQTYERIGSALERRREDFAGRLAGVALYSSADPWHGGWLERFIRDADPATHTAWAAAMGRELRELSADAAELAWTRWLADYWRDRLTGVPSPLSEEERRAMLEWVFGLRTVLPAVVELLVAMPITLGEHTMLFYELREEGLARTAPEPVACLLRHVLAGTTQLRWECGDLETLVGELIDARADRAVLLEVCEAMARLGCPGAAALRKRVS